jgi:hypothetical protein
MDRIADRGFVTGRAMVPTCDPREAEDWFERLPDEAKDEFRAQWRVTALLRAESQRRIRVTSRRYVLEVAVLFGVAGAFLTSSPAGAAVHVAAGVLTGAAASWLRAANFAYVGIVGTAYTLLWICTPFSGLLQWMMVVSVSFGLGMLHAFQRFDGSEV